ncbi:sensor histidine kinase [Paenibacillus protaetiae]|uniref:Sensor histidine kinase n=1 Tax=Paenibacillus protaetiae TaxID=2509456 RepID=A0A4P6EY60_9BACL|nr:sensor histidine kinase [Paenibacillus protaetiae]QAY68022.1 sensor histidine kinase [Paenibacillus protaetiae]
MPKITLFTKIAALLLMMLLPIIGLYYYSNKISTHVLDSELNRSNTDQLSFFQEQVDTTINVMGLWPNLLVQDPDISALRDYFEPMKELDLNTISLIKRIQTKLSIQQSSSDWKSTLSIYSPQLSRVITVEDARAYDNTQLQGRMKYGWQVTPHGDADGYTFSLMTSLPYNSFEYGLMLEVRFDSANITDMLNKFKQDGRRDPFYYSKEYGAIYNSTSDKPFASELAAILARGGFLKPAGSRLVELHGKRYMVNTVLSETTGWYLIDYMPLSDVLGPVYQTNYLFYTIVGLLLLMCCVMAYLLYGQVQVPIKQLVVSFQKLKNGDYAVRLKPKGKGKTEFNFLFARFNLMVEQIQELFEKVYLEQIHVREAKLKQLQSQINPHFFYNCFSFISSMAKLQNYQSVVAMSQALSSYYRYTTRQEKEFVPLTEELQFAGNYLRIQHMRMNRLGYTVEVPDRMLHLPVPPLVIQPLVENAVLHGIEPYPEAGQIRIAGYYDGTEAVIEVEEDGIGLPSEKMLAIQYRLSRPKEDELGYGLWNIQQRMQLRFGENAGLELAASPLGGLRIRLRWKPAEASSGPAPGSTSASGTQSLEEGA